MNRTDFDRDFRRTKRTVNVMFIVVAVFMTAITVGSIFIGVRFAGEIRENGLKGVIEQIWEGDSNE